MREAGRRSPASVKPCVSTTPEGVARGKLLVDRKRSIPSTFRSFNLCKIILSALVTLLVSMLCGFGYLKLYAHITTNLLEYNNSIAIHRDRPDTDFCYSVVELNKWYYNETVLGSRAKHFAWGRELEESLEAAGEPVCYCRRYFVKGMEPDMTYTARTAYVGPVTGSVPLAVAQIRRSRVDAILAGRDGKLLMNPEDIPPEYLLSRKALVTRKGPLSPMRPFVAGRVGESPLDSASLTLLLEEFYPLRMNEVHDMTVYDYKDVPDWVNDPIVGPFNWSASYQPVSWTTFQFAKFLKIGSEIVSYISTPAGFNYSNMPPDPWYMFKTRTDIRELDEVDPFVPLVEVCGEYNPPAYDYEVDKVRMFNIIVGRSPYGLPDYSVALVVFISVIFALGQLIIFPPYM